MQKSAKIVGIINIFVLYCFAIIMTSTNLHNPIYQKNTSTQSTSQFSLIPIGLYQHTSQSENIINTSNSLPFTSINDSFSKFLAINKFTEKNIKTFIIQYTFSSFNFQINYRKSDKIFPFHCFW